MRNYRKEFSDDQVATAIQKSKTFKEAMAHLGQEADNNLSFFLQRRARQLGLDRSHMLGRAHGKGKKRPGQEWASSYVLQQHNKPIPRYMLIRALKEVGQFNGICAICGLGEWRGEPLPLHIVHINGSSSDCRRENLRALCPNCRAVLK